MNDMLSPHFSLAEFERSMTAKRLNINNHLPPDLILRAEALCMEILEPIRKHFGKPVHISSGYRCATLNNAIGGSRASQHMRAEAADIEIAGFSPEDVTRWISISGLPFDQVIKEGGNSGWCHVSHHVGNNRGEVLTANFSAGGATYFHGIKAA